MGDLILVYKRVTALASHTSRVAELLEQVHKEPGPQGHRTTHLCSAHCALCTGRAPPPPAASARSPVPPLHCLLHLHEHLPLHMMHSKIS